MQLLEFGCALLLLLTFTAVSSGQDTCTSETTGLNVCIGYRCDSHEACGAWAFCSIHNVCEPCSRCGGNYTFDGMRECPEKCRCGSHTQCPHLTPNTSTYCATPNGGKSPQFIPTCLSCTGCVDSYAVDLECPVGQCAAMIECNNHSDCGGASWCSKSRECQVCRSHHPCYTLPGEREFYAPRDTSLDFTCPEQCCGWHFIFSPDSEKIIVAPCEGNNVDKVEVFWGDGPLPAAPGPTESTCVVTSIANEAGKFPLMVYSAQCDGLRPDCEDDPRTYSIRVVYNNGTAISLVDSISFPYFKGGSHCEMEISSTALIAMIVSVVLIIIIVMGVVVWKTRQQSEEIAGAALD